MPDRCVAGGCSNTPGKNISLHKFPKEPIINRQWVRFVQTKRAKWSETSSSKLCSAHFLATCFTNYGQALEFGTKLMLHEKAVPTLHSIEPTEDTKSKDKIPASVRKRHVLEVSMACIYIENDCDY